MNHNLVNQFRTLSDKEQSLSDQIGECSSELQPLRPSLINPDRGTDEDKARSMRFKNCEKKLAELNSQREEIRRALVKLQTGADTRMTLAQALYQQAVEQLAQINQGLASFQTGITKETTAVAHAEKRLADASANVENALTAESMTAARAASADATRELDNARLSAIPGLLKRSF